MNINKQRHKLLRILTQQHYDMEAGKYEMLGVDNDILMGKLKCDETKLKLIASELLAQDEIGNYDNSFIGYYSTPKGNASFSNKKYLNIFYDKVWNRTKNFTQTVVPILSLIVAILALTLKINTENEKIKKRLDTIEKKLDLKSKTVHNSLHKKLP